MHGSWYEHGSKTLLQETAHSSGLFSINDCGDIPLDAIYQLCNISEVGEDDQEPNEETSGIENRFHHHSFVFLFHFVAVVLISAP